MRQHRCEVKGYSIQRSKLSYWWVGRGIRNATLSFRSTSKVPILLQAVPVGKFRIEVSGSGGRIDPIILAESEAKAGETTVVKLK
jgi:hypothetical protein